MVNNWNVIPTVSVGGIEFGTDRKIVRKILGKPDDSFRKTPSSVNTTDIYSSFHVYYSAEDKLVAVEFFGKDIYLAIDKQVIFPGKLNVAYEILPDLVNSFGSYISEKYSVGICIEGDTIVSVLVGCKNYYKK